MSQDHRIRRIKRQEVAKGEDSPKPFGMPHIYKCGAQTHSCLSSQAWAQFRAQGLVMPLGLGEQNKSRHTIAFTTAPAGCDSQLPAAGQTGNSWVPASGRGWHHQAHHTSLLPTAQVTIQGAHLTADQPWP